MSQEISEPGGLTRLFIETPLGAGAALTLGPEQSHLLANVLRARSGDTVLVFNGKDGEWRAVIVAIAKRTVTLKLDECTAEQTAVPDLWLCLAPIKRTPLDFVAQKATELGVARIIPVITRRTIVARVNLERMKANAIEAAEQSGRLSVPEIAEPVALGKLLDGWPATRRIMFCDEAGEAPPVAKVLQDAGRGSWAVMTGPEGGFDPDERLRLRQLPFVVPVSLGPRIMRADTAALAALALWQSTVGDWN